LFVTPQYDSALIEQSLLLNRRRNEKEHLKRKLEEHFEELDIVDGMASLGKIKTNFFLRCDLSYMLRVLRVKLQEI
jgi:hypothetical protein